LNSLPVNLTEDLNRALGGDAQAQDAVLLAVYAQLHRIAAAIMRGNGNQRVLQPSALINEAYLKLFHGGSELNVNSRKHFFALAAQQMRHILVDYARKDNADKRKGAQVEFSELFHGVPMRDHDLLALDEALKALEKIAPEPASVVELRFFGGFNYDEIARILNTNVAKVRRDWDAAKSYLYLQMQAKEHGESQVPDTSSSGAGVNGRLAKKVG
jgi:RNA polymerase sigma-70 factor (ECF subfamily)